MNKVILVGRLTDDPRISYSQTQQGQLTIARFTLAIDRRGKDNSADFVGCVAFGKIAEVIEKYCHKGNKIAIDGRIQTGNYTNKDGQKVYTTDVVIENMEFCESKKAEPQIDTSGFIEVPDVETEGLPFN